MEHKVLKIMWLHSCFFIEHVLNTILVRREFVVIFTTVLFTLPLSLYKNVAKLSKVSSKIAMGLEIII